MRKQTLTLLLSLALAMPGFGAGKDKDKISDDLARRDHESMIDVIIQFKESINEKKHKKVKDLGGSFKSELALIGGGVYTVRVSNLAKLARDPDVLYISPDRQLHANLDHATPAIGTDIAYNNAWDGRGIGIAVIDSGVNF